MLGEEGADCWGGVGGGKQFRGERERQVALQGRSEIEQCVPGVGEGGRKGEDTPLRGRDEEKENEKEDRSVGNVEEMRRREKKVGGRHRKEVACDGKGKEKKSEFG